MNCFFRASALTLPLLFASCASHEPAATNSATFHESHGMQVHYLEIVTSDVEGTCATLAKIHNVQFSDPVAEFGGARTADLDNGNRLGVRGSLHAAEEPVMRPYILVEDINAAVEAARAGGCEIAHPPLEIPGQGTFAIYFQGGNQYGLWQN